MKKWKKILPTMIILGVGLTVLMILADPKITSLDSKKSPTVVLNEICSRNGTIGIDDEHIGMDYIELYNPTKDIICLSGWSLSDDADTSNRHLLPEIYIYPEKTLLLYPIGMLSDEYSLDFKISAKGEKIYLRNDQGEIVDEIYVPELEMDDAYAREKDGTGLWNVYKPSPGNSNNGMMLAERESLQAPSFSHKSGYYEKEFILEISAEPGTDIYYTTDGSEPTTKSYLYKDGIIIKDKTNEKNVINSILNVVPDWKDYNVVRGNADKLTVIRAIAIGKENQISSVGTASYIVGQEKYKNCKVMSLIAEPEELYGEDGILVTGIEYDEWYLSSEMSQNGTYERGWTENFELTNFWKDGRNQELVGVVQLFENGVEILNQKTGIRVQGNYTRLQALKNLQLISRKSYSGNRLFEIPFFENNSRHSLYVSPIPEKAYCLELTEGRNLGVQGTDSCALFINGEYWYQATLLEKFDKEYFEEHYGIEADNILYLKDREPVMGEEYYYLYDEMYSPLRDETIDISDKILWLYDTIDVQSFIDWMCFNLYLCNNDISTKKNCVMWRSIEQGPNTYEDGKWRWLLYDVDHCVVSEMTESIDFSDFSIASDNRYYWVLKENPRFCEKFIATAMDMMNTNFSMKNVEEKLGKWGLDLSYGDNFFMKRPEYMIQSLRNEFGLNGTIENVTISVNDTEGGKIVLNTITPDLSNGPWTGKYFSDCVVRATAVPNPGYRFVGWNGTSDSKEEYIKVNVIEGGISLIANFEKE